MNQLETSQSGPLAALVLLGRPSSSTQFEKHVRRVQSVFRGRAVRDQISVMNIGDGIVHVAIRGDAEVLGKLGVSGVESAAPKAIDYVSLPASGFKGKLVGGERRYQMNQLSGPDMVSEVLSTRQPPSSTLVFVNGGFYNSKQKASEHHSPHASIGPTVIPGANLPPHVDVPSRYAKDYVKVDFESSSLTVAPELSANGEVLFKRERLDDAKYQFTPETNRPGDLAHASHPNARTAVVLPQATTRETAVDNVSKTENRVRLVVVTNPGGKRGADGHGMTLPELATLTARLERMNQGPTRSFNMDGGDSSRLGVLTSTGQKLLEVAATDKPTGGAANFVVFTGLSDE
jgi:insecticidal toxin complex protein TccC